jgi:hypothetical protein
MAGTAPLVRRSPVKYGRDPSLHRTNMDTQAIPLRVTAARFLRSVKLFGASEFGPKAKFISLALVTLLCAATGLNVLGRQDARGDQFIGQAQDRSRSK